MFLILASWEIPGADTTVSTMAISVRESIKFRMAKSCLSRLCTLGFDTFDAERTCMVVSAGFHICHRAAPAVRRCFSF